MNESSRIPIINSLQINNATGNFGWFATALCLSCFSIITGRFLGEYPVLCTYLLIWTVYLVYICFNVSVAQKAIKTSLRDTLAWVKINKQFARLQNRFVLPKNKKEKEEESGDDKDGIERESIFPVYDDYRIYCVQFLLIWYSFCYVAYVSRIYCSTLTTVATNFTTITLVITMGVLFYFQSAYYRYPVHSVPAGGKEDAFFRSTVNTQKKMVPIFCVFLFCATFISDQWNVFHDNALICVSRLLIFLIMIVMTEVITSKEQSISRLVYESATVKEPTDTSPDFIISSNVFVNMAQVCFCTWPLIVSPIFWIFGIVVSVVFIFFLLQMNKKISAIESKSNNRESDIERNTITPNVQPAKTETRAPLEKPASETTQNFSKSHTGSVSKKYAINKSTRKATKHNEDDDDEDNTNEKGSDNERAPNQNKEKKIIYRKSNEKNTNDSIDNDNKESDDEEE